MSSSTTDDFHWIGASGGSWDVPVNWDDTTTGQNPATVAPGAGATVVINGGTATPLIVNGPGTAGPLLLEGLIEFNGTIGAGSVTAATGAGVAVYPSSALHATSLLVQSGATLGAFGASAQVMVAGTATVAGTLTASGEFAVAGAASVVLTGGLLDVASSSSGVDVGTTLLGGDGYIDIEAGATLSGSGTLFADYVVSTLISWGDIVIDGVVQAQNIQAVGALDGTGTVEILAGGTFTSTVGTQGTSALTFVLGDGSLLNLSDTPGGRTAIDFPNAGTASALFVTEYPYLNGGSVPFTAGGVSGPGLINNFGAGDRLIAAANQLGGVQTATYTQGANGAGTGTLELIAGDGQAEAYYIFAGSYTLSSFVITVSPDPYDSGAYTGTFQVDLASGTGFGPSAGNGGHGLTYAGPSGGSWADPAYWQDSTTGKSAAAAPGGADTAIINGSTGYAFTALIGGGSAATLETQGNVALSGAVTAGLVETVGAGRLLLSAGGVLSAGTLSLDGTGDALIAYGVDQAAPGGALVVSGTATVADGGALGAEHGGTIRLGALDLRNGGSLTAVSPGGVVQSGTTYVAGPAPSYAIIGGPAGQTAAPGQVVIDAGATITDTSTTALSEIVANTIVANGVIDAHWLSLFDDVTGTGAATVEAGGALTLSVLDPNAAIAFTLDSGASINVVTSGTIGGGNSFLLRGRGDSVYIAYATAEPAPITGLTYGDVIQFNEGAGAAAVAFVPGVGGGTLDIVDVNGTVLATASLVGTGLAGLPYLVSGFDGAQVGVAEPGSYGLSAGTAIGNTFTYTGPAGGAWGDANNWTDTTTGLPAAVAPGAADVAVIAAQNPALPYAGYLYPTTMLTGMGAAATLDIDNALLLHGSFSAGTLMSDTNLPSVEIDAGSTLTVGTLSAGFDFQSSELLAQGAGAVLDVTGQLAAPVIPPRVGFGLSAVASDGGRIAAAAVTGYISFAAADGTLDLPTALTGEVQIGMSGTDNRIVFATPNAATLAVAAAITGFADTDVIDVTLTTPVDHVVFDQTSTAGGVLSLIGAGGTTISALNFNGNFAGHTFYSYAAGPDTTEIVLDVTCFRAGTRIRTPAGDVPVETLAVGDLVLTAAGAARPVRWIGRRRIDCRR
ncbi:Hint domain-containing protein, partial [Acidisphaera rubrifaciens]|uniref:Hint domain-containing protein n=1 Tax=Acidisphaera rubrifaciens TaxID=50715 RepID=UPI000662A651